MAGHEKLAGTLAAEKCKVWGDENTEPSGGQVQQCSRPTTSGCAQMDVYIEYQCTGGKASEN